MEKPTEVACAIIVREGMILATKRNQNVSNSEMWEFPGGKPVNDEAADECVVRRVQEELNVNINILEHLKPYEVCLGSKKKFRIYPFVSEIIDGRMVLNNHSRAEWFMPMQLMSLAWPETDLPIIEEIVARIFQKGKIV